MKKNIIIILFLIIPFISIERTSADPVNISVGASIWYAWWQPAWSTMEDLSLPFTVSDSDFEFDFTEYGLYGPLFSVKFLKKWSISSVFMIGKYKAVIDKTYTLGPIISRIYYNRNILKYDSDTTVSYSITNYLKIFAGFKIQGYDYKQDMLLYKYDPIDDTNQTTQKNTTTLLNYGPGIGFGLTFNIADNLFFLFNASGILLYGKLENKVDDFNTNFVPEPPMPQTIIMKLLTYGGNTSVSLAYYIPSMSTSLILGFRYQVLASKAIPDNEMMIDKLDHFWGISFTAVYSFSVGG